RRRCRALARAVDRLPQPRRATPTTAVPDPARSDHPAYATPGPSRLRRRSRYMDGLVLPGLCSYAGARGPTLRAGVRPWVPGDRGVAAPQRPDPVSPEELQR